MTVRLFTSKGIDLGVFLVAGDKPPHRITMDDWQTSGAVEEVRTWTPNHPIPEYRFDVERQEWMRTVRPLPAPGMTDLMVTPESIDQFLAENPPEAT